jgi:TP901 family phage tail tape measure protein
MGALPPVFIEFLGSAAGFHTTADGVTAKLATVEAEGAGNMEKLASISQAAFLGVGAAALIAGAHVVHMAGDFQSQMTRVQTGAGEAAGNMKMVGDGVLAMAGQVGQSTEQLTSGLYTVESAGYHGADALNVLKVSAEGAKVGAAEMAPVTDAVTTALNAYSLKASDATNVMNALVATESLGKTNMEALAGSMSSILPVAAAAHVGFNEVMGAMATMTAQGTSADVAATYLRQTIGQLSNPSAKAAQEMRGLGLDSVQVAQNLGKNGLAATLTELTDAIQSKLGPSGTVIVETLRKAGQSTTEYEKALANLKPAEQTQIGALADMVGGTKSMMAALQLTGPHMETFKANTAAVAEHVKAGGNAVEGWKEVQGTFNQRLAEAKASTEAMAIAIGQKLMPYASAMLDWVSKATDWLGKHKLVLEAVGGAILGILVVGLWAATMAAQAFAVALLANPLTWIILGIMALGAAVVLLALNWKTVWTWIKEITSDVVNWLVGAWHWLAGETVSVWKDHIVAPAVAAWNALASFFSGAWHSVTDIVSGAWNWLKVNTYETWNTYIYLPITLAWTKLQQWLSSAWHAVADPIVGAWHWIAGVTATVWNGISGFFAKWWPLLLVIFAFPIALMIAAWNHLHTTAEAAAKMVWGHIQEFLSSNWATISGLAKDAWGLIKDYIVKPSQEVWDWLVGLWDTSVAWLSDKWDSLVKFAKSAWRKISDDTTSAWNDVYAAVVGPAELIWHYLVGLWDGLMRWLSGVWRSLVNEAQVVWGQLEAQIIQPIERAVSRVGSIISNIGTELWNGLVSAWHTVEHFGQFFESIGDGIVSGIISGVKKAGNALFGTLKDLANGALDAAKSFLGINSPSKLFADNVGTAIPEGIAKGVNDSAHLAHGAVTSLAGGMAKIGFGSPGSLEPAFAGGSNADYGGNSGPVTVINVTVSGSVVAERDLASTIQRVMGQNGARNPQTYTPYRR